MKLVSDILSLSTTYLQQRGISQPRRQAEELLCDVLGLDRLQLYLNFEKPLTETELQLSRERLARRARGEPLQYIHGKVEFYDCQFLVSPAVLIPRQETEILVDKIAAYFKTIDVADKQVWDICCGSGCIGLALKKKFPELQVTLSDISEEALVIARQNAKLNETDVTFKQGDLLEPFRGQKAHFIICNPPYISDEEYKTLDNEVREYEPRLALVGGERGTEFYERFSEQLPEVLYPGGCAWFEIGYQQGELMKALFQEKRWKQTKLENDWAGHSRFFFLENE